MGGSAQWEAVSVAVDGLEGARVVVTGAAGVLGWQSTTSLAEGLARTVAWYQRVG